MLEFVPEQRSKPTGHSDQMEETRVLAALSVSHNAQWDRLREYYIGLFPKRLLASWQNKKQQQRQQRRDTPRRRRSTVPCTLQISVVMEELSLGQFWDLHDSVRRTNLYTNTQTSCLRKIYDRVNSSQAALVTASVCVELNAGCFEEIAHDLVSHLPASTVFSGILQGTWFQQHDHSAPAKIHFAHVYVSNIYECIRKPWVYRLNRLANTRKMLLHSNALISTLGGGYFM